MKSYITIFLEDCPKITRSHFYSSIIISYVACEKFNQGNCKYSWRIPKYIRIYSNLLTTWGLSFCFDQN